ncbi:ribosome biogenesis protein Utp30p [Trichomonascus vanleenenianus]|uniref:ribosomal L1 domain-containing protein n=1 Tax=Trichomonascus vanleenenianus TaxID=2268995 RepID=UPI003ECAAE41
MISKDKVQEAAEALLKFLADKKEAPANDLLADEEEDAESIFITIATKKYLSDKKQLKPKKAPLVHPIYSADNTSVCLFSKDPQRTYKDALQAEGSPAHGLVDRVVGVSKLKGKFKPYQARRQLASNHDLFLAEDSVVTTLPKLLGKIFYEGSVSKIPLSVKINRKNGEIDAAAVKKQIESILNSTIFVVPAGTTVSIKVAKSTFEAAQVAENVASVVDYFVKNVKAQDGIRSVELKTANSPALPIYIAEKLYDESDIAEEKKTKETKTKKDDKKRKRHDKLTRLETALAEVVEEEDLERLTKKKLKDIEA